MFKFFKKILKKSGYLFSDLFFHGGAQVLMYHSIGDEEYALSPKEFEEHLKYIKETRLDVVSADALVEMIRKGNNLDSKIVLTFDDGYENNYTQAFPLLKKYNMKATIFLATGLVGGKNRKRNGELVTMLSWSQIQEMAESNLIRFYPHSHNHLKLTKLNETEAIGEIKKSKDILIEKNLGKADIFAYPFGRFNDSLKNILKDMDFKAAFCVKFGRVSKNGDVFEIKRNAIDEHIDFKTFKRIVNFRRL